MNDSRNALRLNIGFILHQNVGYVREFPIEIPGVHLPPDVDVTDLNGIVKVTRTAQGLLLQATLSALERAACVRCLDEFEQQLQVEFTELYAFSQKSVTDSGLIVPENGKIDLTPIVREEMLLAMPISPLCDPECKGLCPICGENLNKVQCSHEEEPVDPRLSGLKAFLDHEGME